MELKYALRKIFREEMQSLDERQISFLEQRLLSELKTKQKSTVYRFALPFAFLAIALLLYATKIPHSSSQSQSVVDQIIQPVSADEILNAMQLSINSERLHVVMETKTNGGDTSDEADSLGNDSISETWIDRKNHLSRLERRDLQGRLRILVITNGENGEAKSYRFALGGKTHTFESLEKKGVFAETNEFKSYEDAIDLTLRQDYVSTLRESGVSVDASFKEISYLGRPAYELTLNHPVDKMGTTTTEILTIDQETKLPYKNILTETGRPDGFFEMTTAYTFSNDFSDDVFELKAPAGYSLMP